MVVAESNEFPHRQADSYAGVRPSGKLRSDVVIVQPDELIRAQILVSETRHLSHELRGDSVIVQPGQLPRGTAPITGLRQLMDVVRCEVPGKEPHRVGDVGALVLSRRERPEEGVDGAETVPVEGELELLVERRASQSPPLERGRERRVRGKAEVARPAPVSESALQGDRPRFVPDPEPDRLTIGGDAGWGKALQPLTGKPELCTLRSSSRTNESWIVSVEGVDILRVIVHSPLRIPWVDAAERGRTAATMPMVTAVRGRASQRSCMGDLSAEEILHCRTRERIWSLLVVLMPTG